MPLLAAANVASDSTSTASKAPAAPNPTAVQDSDTGAPVQAASNTKPPRMRASNGDNKVPAAIAGTANSSPSTSVKMPICSVVAPRLLSIAISAARARITIPAVIVK